MLNKESGSGVKAAKKEIAGIFGQDRANNFDLVGLAKLQEGKDDYSYIAKFKNYYLRVWVDVSKDWDYYSRAWHRSHGPKKTVEGRYIILYRTNGKKEYIEVPSFRGNWLFKALKKRFNLKPVKCSKALIPVQLDREMKVNKLRKIAGVTFYERTLKGSFVDVCAVSDNGTTFHSDTMVEAIRGLKKKIKAKAASESKVINYRIATDLGFCEVGISDFCEQNGLDPADELTRQELRNVVIQDRAGNCKYKAELKQLGINLNC